MRSNHKKLNAVDQLKADIVKFADSNLMQLDQASAIDQANKFKKAAAEKSLDSIYAYTLDTTSMAICAYHKNWEGVFEYWGRAFKLSSENQKWFERKEFSQQSDVIFRHFNVVLIRASHDFINQLKKKPAMVELINAVLNGDEQRIKQSINQHGSEVFMNDSAMILFSKAEEIHGVVEKIPSKIPPFLSKIHFLFGLMRIARNGLKHVIQQTQSSGEIKNKITENVVNTCKHLTNAQMKWRSTPEEQYSEMALVMLAQHFISLYTDEQKQTALTLKLGEFVDHFLKNDLQEEAFLLAAKYLIKRYCTSLLSRDFTLASHQQLNIDIHNKLGEFAADSKTVQQDDVHLAYVWTALVKMYCDFMARLGKLKHAAMTKKIKKKGAEIVNLVLSDYELKELYTPERMFDSPYAFYQFFDSISKSLSFLLEKRKPANSEPALYFPLPALSGAFQFLLHTFPNVIMTMHLAHRPWLENDFCASLSNETDEVSAEASAAIKTAFKKAFNNDDTSYGFNLMLTIIHDKRNKVLVDKTTKARELRIIPDYKGKFYDQNVALKLLNALVALLAFITQEIKDSEKKNSKSTVTGEDDYRNRVLENYFTQKKAVDNLKPDKLDKIIQLLGITYMHFFEIIDCFIVHAASFYNERDEVILLEKIKTEIIEPQLEQFDRYRAERKAREEFEEEAENLSKEIEEKIESRLMQALEKNQKKPKSNEQTLKKQKAKKKTKKVKVENCSDLPTGSTAHQEESDEEEFKPEEHEQEENGSDVFQTSTEAETITQQLSKAFRLFQKKKFHEALSAYQNLTAYPKQLLNAWDGILACQINIYNDELNQSLNAFRKLKPLLDEVTPEYDELKFKRLKKRMNAEINPAFIEGCYLGVEETKNKYEQFLVEHRKLLERYKKDMQDANTLKNTQNEELNVSLDILKNSEEQLSKVWTQCKKEKNELDHKPKISILRHFSIMEDGFKVWEKNYTKAEREHLGNLILIYYFFPDEHVESSDFLLAHKIYQIGLHEFRKRGKENFKKYGTYSRWTRLTRALDDFNTIFAAKGSLDLSLLSSRSAHSSVPVSTAGAIHIVDSTSSAHSSSANAESISEDILMSTEFQPTEFNKKNPSQEMLRWYFIHSDLAIDYDKMSDSGILDSWFPLGAEFHRLRRLKHQTIVSKLALIADKIKNTPVSERKNDLILAHIFAVILHESLPAEALRHNLSMWLDKTLPLKRLADTFNLSLQCQSALHAYLTVKLKDERKPLSLQVHKECAAYIETLEEIALKQNQRLVDELDFNTVPKFVEIYGSDGLLSSHYGEPPLVKSDHSSGDIDVRTNIEHNPKDNYPFPCVASKYVKNLHHPVVEGKTLMSMSVMVSQEPRLKQVRDLTIHHIVTDVVGQRSVYCHKDALIDLQKKELRFTQPLAQLNYNRQLFLRMFIDSVHYPDFRVVERDEIRQFVENKMNKMKANKNKFLSGFFENPAQLYYLMKSRFTTGKAAQHIEAAMDLNLLGVMFHLPAKVHPLSTETMNNLLDALEKLDAKVVADPDEQLALIILNVLYHSCLPFRDVGLFDEACMHVRTVYPQLNVRILFGKTMFIERMKAELDAGQAASTSSAQSNSVFAVKTDAAHLAPQSSIELSKKA